MSNSMLFLKNCNFDPPAGAEDAPPLTADISSQAVRKFRKKVKNDPPYCLLPHCWALQINRF